MATATDEITVGDDMTDIVVVIEDSDGRARDITGWTVRLFVEGQTSGDKPYSPAGNWKEITNGSTTSGSTTLTRAAGNFTSDGWLAGMLLFGTGIPAGSRVVSVSTTTLVMSLAATATGGPSLTVNGWYGITGSITAAPTGEATFAGIGSLINIGALASDIYVGKVRCLDGSSSEIGWSNSGQNYVSFKAVQPGSGA